MVGKAFGGRYKTVATVAADRNRGSRLPNKLPAPCLAQP